MKYSFPTIYDSVLQLNISNIKKWGYLQGGFRTGSLSWSSQGRKTGSISIAVYVGSSESYIKLSYRSGDSPRDYKVQLVSVPSNLGKGKVWYFLCPKTQKRCRILYCIDGYFFHREAFSHSMYDSQTQSKAMRRMEKAYGSAFRLDKLYDELYSKGSKKFYKGKPTKRFLKIWKEIKKAEAIDLRGLREMF